MYRHVDFNVSILIRSNSILIIISWIQWYFLIESSTIPPSRYIKVPRHTYSVHYHDDYLCESVSWPLIEKQKDHFWWIKMILEMFYWNFLTQIQRSICKDTMMKSKNNGWIKKFRTFHEMWKILDQAYEYWILK